MLEGNPEGVTRSEIGSWVGAFIRASPGAVSWISASKPRPRVDDTASWVSLLLAPWESFQWNEFATSCLPDGIWIKLHHTAHYLA